jgi:hypothetical protein
MITGTRSRRAHRRPDGPLAVAPGAAKPVRKDGSAGARTGARRRLVPRATNQRMAPRSSGSKAAVRAALEEGVLALRGKLGDPGLGGLQLGLDGAPLARAGDGGQLGAEFGDVGHEGVAGVGGEGRGGARHRLGSCGARDRPCAMRPPKQAAAPPAPREGPERSGGPAGLTILSREEWRAAPGENRLAGRLRAETPSVPLSPSCRDGPTLWRTSAPRFTAGSAWGGSTGRRACRMGRGGRLVALAARPDWRGRAPLTAPPPLVMAPAPDASSLAA